MSVSPAKLPPEGTDSSSNSKWFILFQIFFNSNYLNRVTETENRATVLSFRGLSMNLSYGILTWLCGMQTAYLSGRIEMPEGDRTDEITHQIFTGATQWWWVYFTGVLLFLWLFRTLKIRKSWNELLK
jgi:hypothetical protein